MFDRRPRRRLGQTGTEYMMIISVVVIAVVGAAYVFVEPFGSGVDDLGNDVKEILGGQSIGGVGRGGPGGPGGDGVNGSSPTRDPATDGPGTDGMGAPPSGDNNRSYDGRVFSNTQDVAYDPNAAKDPLYDILGPGTQNRLNGMPSMPTMTASLPGRGDSQLAAATAPGAARVAVLRDEEDA